MAISAVFNMVSTAGPCCSMPLPWTQAPAAPSLRRVESTSRQSALSKLAATVDLEGAALGLQMAISVVVVLFLLLFPFDSHTNPALSN